MASPDATSRIPDRYFRHEVATGFHQHERGFDAVIAGFDGDPRRTPAPDMTGRSTNFGCSYLFHGGGWFIDRHRVRHALRPGSMCLLLPDAEQTLHHHRPDYATCYLCFNAESYHRLRAAGLLRVDQQVVHAPLDLRIVRRFADLMDALATPAAHPPRRLFLQALDLVDDLQWRATRVQTDRDLEPARRRLGERLDQPLALPALAADLGIEYDDFRRRFRRAYGCAPGEYRIRRRIEAASALLKERRVEEVARALGYCDAFAFSKQFKRAMGVPPKRYQAMMRAGLS